VAKLSKGQIARLAKNAGFGGASNDAALVALAESGGVTTAKNPSGATGLWQIMPSHGSGMEDPKKNAATAARLYKGRGNNFKDWQVVTDCPGGGGGAISSQVRRCLEKKAKTAGANMAGGVPPGGAKEDPKGGGVFELVEQFFKWLTDKDTWLNLGKLGLGITALLTGIKYAVGIDLTPQRLGKAAVGAAL
jgi:hypothetical protein